MKKFILCMFLLMLPTFMFAQKEAEQQQQYYIYNIVTLRGNFAIEGVRVWVDNGKTIERLRNEKGQRIKFYTTAGALMYFLSKGWTLFNSGSTISGNTDEGGKGSTDTDTYWIIRKPCTKAEFDQAVADGQTTSLL